MFPSWMCAPGLVWARDTLLDLEVWTYYSTSPVPAWKNCVAEQREQIAQAIILSKPQDLNNACPEKKLISRLVTLLGFGAG